MDNNLIVVKVPKDKAYKKKGKSYSEARPPGKKFRKDKEKSDFSKPLHHIKSPNLRPQKEIIKKEPKIITIRKPSLPEEEKTLKEKEINEILKDDDTKVAKPKEIKIKRAASSNLQKRNLDTFLNEGKSILKFDGDDEEGGQEKDKKKQGELGAIEEIFGDLKKVKRDNQENKETKETRDRESSQSKRILQLRSAEPSFEDLERANAPWMTSSTSKIENPMIRFHNEIIDFVEHVGPSKKDQATRKRSFDKLTELILEICPHATIKAFGSYVTNLYLPQSDIDVAVIEPTLGTQALINKVARAFMKNSDYENINVIKSAKVPLVKVVESSTGINFDISFNKLDGVHQVEEIQKALDYYPEMRYMILVIKCFLKQRDLNETYQGGIGSFLLFCLVLTFLREIRKDYKHDDREDDIDRILLSEYVVKFLDYFANFDHFRKQIIVGGGGDVVNKYVRAFGFSVISPQDESHDIGAAVFRVKEVFGIFKNRVHFMTNYNFKRGESLLKYLVDCRYLS